MIINVKHEDEKELIEIDAEILIELLRSGKAKSNAYKDIEIKVI